MSFTFDAKRGLVVVEAQLVGPATSAKLQMALDTGATTSTVNLAPLVGVGYDPAALIERIEVTTGSGIEYVPRIPVWRLAALGKRKTHFPVLALTLPPKANVDGVLGLDFLRGHRLSLDFKKGTITLT